MSMEIDVDLLDYPEANDEVIAASLAQEFLDDPQGWILSMDPVHGDYFSLEVGLCVDPT